MNVFELERAIQKTGLGPLYLIAGEEDLLRDQAVAAIKAAVSAQDAGLADFNVDVLYGDETDASEIIARAGEAPVFAARRLMIVKAADKLSAREGEALVPYVQAPCDSTTLVFVASKPDGRTKFTLVLKQRATVVECGPLPPAQLPGWIRAEAARNGVRLDEPALLLLRDLTAGHSLYLIRRELEKLASYVGNGRSVSAADVEAVRGGEAGASVFDLTIAIRARNRARALRILSRNLDLGEAPLRILGSLVWQYRQLWRAREAFVQGRESETGRLLRMQPFRVREFLQPFSERHLNRAFRLFLETDSKLKGNSATAPPRVLEALLWELCKLGHEEGAGRPRRPAAAAPTAAPKAAMRTGRPVKSGRPSAH
jgi:DNA polymerase-3 subunit delta